MSVNFKALAEACEKGHYITTDFKAFAEGPTFLGRTWNKIVCFFSIGKIDTLANYRITNVAKKIFEKIQENPACFKDAMKLFLALNGRAKQTNQASLKKIEEAILKFMGKDENFKKFIKDDSEAFRIFLDPQNENGSSKVGNQTQNSNQPPVLNGSSPSQNPNQPPVSNGSSPSQNQKPPISLEEAQKMAKQKDEQRKKENEQREKQPVLEQKMVDFMDNVSHMIEDGSWRELLPWNYWR